MAGRIRIILTLFLGLVIAGPAPAQLNDGGIAPDFTLTDLDGVSHTLYTYLDQNQVVVLDFFAVWCSICKADAEYLKAVYQLYGPDGTGQVVMLSVETDDASTDDQAREFAAEFGAGNPHFNQTGNLAELYNQQFFPLYYVIAPDRSYRVIEGRQERMQEQMIEAILAAPPLRTVENDLRILSYDAPVGSICDDKFYPLIRVQNYGSNQIESMYVETLVDGEVQSRYPYLETIDPYFYVDLRLPWVPNLNDGWHRVSFRFDEVNGQPDGDPDNGITGGDFLILSAGESLEIILSTDPYPKETSWKLEESGKVLAYQGGYTQGLTSDTTTVCAMPDACYRLVLYDSYGDGMSAGGATVLFRGQEIALLESADFQADSAWINFCVWPAGIKNDFQHSENSFSVYPNPGHGVFYLKIDHEALQNAEILVSDLTGITIWHRSLQQMQNNMTIDLSDSPPGVYFVRLKRPEGILTRRLIINH